MNDHKAEPTRTGRGGAIVVILLTTLTCVFWIYQGVLRRQRMEWLGTVRSLGLDASVIPASQWSAQMYVPGPQHMVERDVVIVMVDSESEGQALLKAPAECPDDVKIYTFDRLSAKGHSRIEERFPTAVVFTRITN